MDHKKEILEGILKSGKGRREIEKEMGYSRHYLDHMLAKGANEHFLSHFRKYVASFGQVRIEEPRAPYGVFKDCDHFITVRGRDMEPLILQGSTVAGKALSNPDRIQYGELYIVKTANGMESIRYIQPDPVDASGVLLVATDPKMSPSPLRRSDIVRVYHAMYVVNAS